MTRECSIFLEDMFYITCMTRLQKFCLLMNKSSFVVKRTELACVESKEKLF